MEQKVSPPASSSDGTDSHMEEEKEQVGYMAEMPCRRQQTERTETEQGGHSLSCSGLFIITTAAPTTAPISLQT